jgi:hypothetical protein
MLTREDIDGLLSRAGNVLTSDGEKIGSSGRSGRVRRSCGGGPRGWFLPSQRLRGAGMRAYEQSCRRC